MGNIRPSLKEKQKQTKQFITISETGEYKKLHSYALKLLNKHLFYRDNEDTANDIVGDAHLKYLEYIEKQKQEITEKIKQSGMYPKNQEHIFIPKVVNDKLEKHMKNKFENQNMKLRYLYRTVYTSTMDYLRDIRLHGMMDTLDEIYIAPNQEDFIKQEDVMKQIRKLDKPYQNLFTKIWETDLTLQEIAQEEGVSIDAITSRLTRARRKLKELL